MKHLLGRVDSVVFLSTNSLADLISSVLANVLRRLLARRSIN